MTTGAKTMHDLRDEMGHLNEAQMDDALIGDLATEAAGHLAACSVCQQQVAEARMPLESFKAVTLEWSERRSATMPVSLSERALHESAVSRRVWGSAVAALLALMVVVPFGMRRNGESSMETKIAMESEQVQTAQLQRTAVVGATGVVSGQMQQGDANAEQIARDNQMLSEIDRELDSNTARSAAMELQDVQGQAVRPAAGQAIQD